MPVANLLSGIDPVVEDSGRHSRRHNLRLAIAANELIDISIGEHRDQKTAVDASVDQATEAHAQATTPLQEKLAALERQIAAAMVAKKEHTDLLMQRRALLDSLEAENNKLAKVSAEAKERHKIIDAEIERLRLSKDKLAYSMQLQHPDYANPVWLAQREGFRRIAEMLRGIHKQNEKSLAELRTSIEERGTRATADERKILARNQHMVDAFGEVELFVNRRSAELDAAIRDE